MGKVLKYLVIHCSDTPEGRKTTADDIRRWHMAPKTIEGKVIYLGKEYPNKKSLPSDKIGGIPIKNLNGRGWDRVGYSDILHLDGVIENLTPYNDDNIVDSNEKTWGVAGHNSSSRHIVYVGGMNSVTKKAKDTRTSAQVTALYNYILETIKQSPQIQIAGHNQFSSKKCPSFDILKQMWDWQIADINIYNPKSKINKISYMYGTNNEKNV